MLQPAGQSRAAVIVPCGLGGWTDGPPCCLLFSLSTNERPAGVQSRSNESSRVWARIESWVVQSVRRTTISPEYHGWMRVGDGNVTQLIADVGRNTSSRRPCVKDQLSRRSGMKVTVDFEAIIASELSGTLWIVNVSQQLEPLC